MKTQGPNLHPLLKAFCPVVDCIADLFGSNCEVVLHDITQPEKSIVKIRNGHVTGRKVGDPLTDLGLKMIKDAEKHVGPVLATRDDNRVTPVGREPPADAN